MIRYSVMYPNEEGKSFDIDYYINKHMKKVGSLPLVRKITVEKGISSKEHGTRAPFICIANIYYDSVEDFRYSFDPNSQMLREDIKNFSNIEPVRQIGSIEEDMEV